MNSDCRNKTYRRACDAAPGQQFLPLFSWVITILIGLHTAITASTNMLRILVLCAVVAAVAAQPSTCASGYCGTLCRELCPPNCATGKCSSSCQVCDGTPHTTPANQNTTAATQCDKGWTDPSCSSLCPPNCASEVCSMGGTCLGVPTHSGNGSQTIAHQCQVSGRECVCLCRSLGGLYPSPSLFAVVNSVC